MWNHLSFFKAKSVLKKNINLKSLFFFFFNRQTEWKAKCFFFFFNINVKLHFQKAKWAVAFQVAKENIRTKRCECFSLSFFRYNWENPNFLYFLTQPFYKNIYFHVFPVWMKGPKDLGLGTRIMYRFFFFLPNFYC